MKQLIQVIIPHLGLSQYLLILYKIKIVYK